MVCLLLIGVSGCRSTPEPVVAAPRQHMVQREGFTLYSEFQIGEDHPLVEELSLLREQVRHDLQLPPQTRNVSVYLFSSESDYQKFLAAVYPTLPDRRAYFVGSSVELAVFTYWGDRIQEDLRHEYTHGVLHACLKQVPLWLDEGLAEYFEVPGKVPGAVQPEYAQRLAGAVAKGWRPDMDRLEKIQNFSDLTYFDYQEAWAWVHYLMHSSPETRMVLLDYMKTLQSPGPPPKLHLALKQNVPEVGPRFLNYLANLHTVRMLAQEGLVKAQSPVINPNPLQQMGGTQEVPPFAPPEIDLGYQVELPQNLPEFIEVPGETPGSRISMPAAPLYREAHREGWSDAIQLFLTNRLTVPIRFQEQYAARQWGIKNRRFTNDTLHDGYLAGLEDCHQALDQQAQKYPPDIIQQALQAQSQEQIPLPNQTPPPAAPFPLEQFIP